MSDHEFAEEPEIYATLVEINQEPTELYKILKFENLVSGGGEAKQVISDGYVYLNGELETRKRKKVYVGDLISFNGQYFQIALKGETELYELVDEESLPQEKEIHCAPKKSSLEKSSPKKRVAEKKQESAAEQEKTELKVQKLRKPISF